MQSGPTDFSGDTLYGREAELTWDLAEVPAGEEPERPARPQPHCVPVVHWIRLPDGAGAGEGSGQVTNRTSKGTAVSALSAGTDVTSGSTMGSELDFLG